MPPGVRMTEAELRDHAAAMLTAIVDDIGATQTSGEQHRKSQGGGVAHLLQASGRLHGADRMQHRFTFLAVLGEFRALRASVLRLYEASGATDLSDVRRFNEAVDEALTESMHQYAVETDLLRAELDVNAKVKTSLVAEISDRRTAEQEIKALYRRLVSAQDEERRRISRDIHDQLGQQLTALRMTLEALDASRDAHSWRTHVGRARQLAEAVDRGLDFLPWELRPVGALEQLGLAVALETLVAGWSEHFAIAATFQGPTSATLRLPLDIATNVYSLVQEALHNVAKHAGARHVAVGLQARDNQTVVIVKDDGCGFDRAHVAARASQSGLGLVSMRERAALCGGTLDIVSEAGVGTTIVVTIPVVPGPAA